MQTGTGSSQDLETDANMNWIGSELKNRGKHALDPLKTEKQMQTSTRSAQNLKTEANMN